MIDFIKTQIVEAWIAGDAEAFRDWCDALREEEARR